MLVCSITASSTVSNAHYLWFVCECTIYIYMCVEGVGVCRGVRGDKCLCVGCVRDPECTDTPGRNETESAKGKQYCERKLRVQKYERESSEARTWKREIKGSIKSAKRQREKIPPGAWKRKRQEPKTQKSACPALFKRQLRISLAHQPHCLSLLILCTNLLKGQGHDFRTILKWYGWIDRN